MIILGKSAFKPAPQAGPDDLLNGIYEGYITGKQLSLQEQKLAAEIAAQKAREKLMSREMTLREGQFGMEQEAFAADKLAGEALGKLGAPGSRAQAAKDQMQGGLDAATGAISQVMGIPLPQVRVAPGAISGRLRKEHQETLDWASRVTKGMPFQTANRFMDIVGQRIAQDEMHALRGEVQQEIISTFQKGLLDDVHASGKTIESPQTAAQVEEWIKLLDNPTTNPEAIRNEFQAFKQEKANAAALEAQITNDMEVSSKKMQHMASIGFQVPSEAEVWRNKRRYGEIDQATFHSGMDNFVRGMVPVFDPVTQKDVWVDQKQAGEMKGLFDQNAKNHVQQTQIEDRRMERAGVIRGQLEMLQSELADGKLAGKYSAAEAGAIGEALGKVQDWMLKQAEANPNADPDELRARAYDIIENQGISLPRLQASVEEFDSVARRKGAEFMDAMGREDGELATAEYMKTWMRTREFPRPTDEKKAVETVKEVIKPQTDEEVLLETGVELVPGELAAAKAKQAAVGQKGQKARDQAVEYMIQGGYDGPPPLSRATWAKAMYWAKANGKQTFVSDRSPLESNPALKAAGSLQRLGREMGWALPSTDEEKSKLRRELAQELQLGQSGNH